MQGSKSKSLGRSFLGFASMLAGGFVAVAGVLILAGGDPAHLRPFGAFFVLSGLLLLPPIGRRIGERWPKLSAWYAAPLMGALLLVIGLTSTSAVIAAWERDHPEIVAKREAARKARKEAAQAQERAETQKEAEQAQAVSLAKRKDRQRALSTMWDQVTAQMEPCEKSQRYLAQMLGRPGALVQSYQMASQGQQVCYQAWTGVQRVGVPTELSEKASKLATEGLAGCATAMLARMTFFDLAGKVIDGDRRPSKLAGAQAQNQAASTATLQCVAKLTDAALTDGINLEKR